MRFKIIIAAYNCDKWIENNLNALLKQKFTDWDAVVLDDCSSDSTPERIKKFTVGHTNIKAIFNSNRIGALHNQVIGIEHLQPEDEDVIIIIDGDDWLKNENSLSIVAKTYGESDVWMTYGNYEIYPSGKKGGTCMPIPPDYNPRISKWIFSHLRTFKFFLYKNLSRDDFRFTGTDVFYMTSGDGAIMRPLAEFAGEEHIGFIDKPLLVYNFINPLGVGKVHKSLMSKCAGDIKKKMPYTKITKQELLKKKFTSFC